MELLSSSIGYGIVPECFLDDYEDYLEMVKELKEEMEVEEKDKYYILELHQATIKAALDLCENITQYYKDLDIINDRLLNTHNAPFVLN